MILLIKIFSLFLSISGITTFRKIVLRKSNRADTEIKQILRSNLSIA